MKKSNFKTIFSLLVQGAIAGFVFASCSDKEELIDNTIGQDGARSVSFSINEKDYEAAEDVAGTRAQQVPQLVDLGDGIMAEVSIEGDTTKAVNKDIATRAIYGAAHYTIQAYQAGVKKGELKGTFSGTNFTPDAGYKDNIPLPHGTYDFVCFNDKVSAVGTQFTVNRADAGTARFTIQRGVVINQDPKQYVAFSMKHAGAYVNTAIHFVNCTFTGVITSVFSAGPSYAGAYEPYDPAERLKYTVETAPNTIPETMIYDFATDSYSFPAMGQVSKSFAVEGQQLINFPRVGDKVAINNDYKFIDYWLPNTDCANLKLTFTFGELYGRSLVGKSITVPTHKLVEPNKQYRIIVKLIMGYMYLFSDGTAGELSKNTGKTPVGVVIDPYKRIAVALNDAVSSYGGSTMEWSNSANTQESASAASSYKQLFGLDYTEAWGTISYSSSAPMQAAKNYYQTAGYGNSYGSPTDVGTWFVPNVTDFIWMGISLGMLEHRKKNSVSGFADFSYLIPADAPTTGFTGSRVTFPQMNMTRFNKAFTDVGGTAPAGTYWTRTECLAGSEYKLAAMSVNFTPGAGYAFDLMSKNNYAKVRPFIRY